MRRALFVGIAGALLAGCLRPAPPPPQPVRYLLYGDSLSEDSVPYLAQFGTVGNRYFGGSAPCNWLNSLPGDAQHFAPSSVLIQFSGNLPTCMNGRDPTLGYEQDLVTLAQFWRARGVPVIMVISPLTQKGDLVWAETAERTVASTLGLVVRDAGQSVLNAGVFTFFLPCLAPSEQTCGAEQAGQVRVRDVDGVHFAPAGAARFAGAEAGGVRATS